MSINFDNKLILKLKASWLLGGTLVVLHTGALVIVAVVPLSWVVRLALFGVIAVSLYRSLMRNALHKGDHAIRWAELEGDGGWYLALGNTDPLGPWSVKGYYAKPWLIIVRLAHPARRLPLTLVVAPDTVDREAFKNLRVRLNLGGTGN